MLKNARVRIAAPLVLVGRRPAMLAAQAPTAAGRRPGPTFKAQVEYVEVEPSSPTRRALRPRPEEGRLPGVRGRQAQTIPASSFVDIPVERDERPLFAAHADRAGREDQRAAVRRPRLRPDARRPARARRARSASAARPAVHRAEPRRQRSDGGRFPPAAAPTRARNSPATSGCCSPRSTSSWGSKLAVGDPRQERRILPPARRRIRQARVDDPD